MIQISTSEAFSCQNKWPTFSDSSREFIRLIFFQPPGGRKMRVPQIIQVRPDRFSIEICGDLGILILRKPQFGNQIPLQYVVTSRLAGARMAQGILRSDALVRVKPRSCENSPSDWSENGLPHDFFHIFTIEYIMFPLKILNHFGTYPMFGPTQI